MSVRSVAAQAVRSAWDWQPTRPQLALAALMLLTVLLMMIWERRQRGYATDYRRVWKRDVAAQFLYSAAIAPAALLINRMSPTHRCCPMR